jgi:hypothetical protein
MNFAGSSPCFIFIEKNIGIMKKKRIPRSKRPEALLAAVNKVAETSSQPALPLHIYGILDP